MPKYKVDRFLLIFQVITKNDRATRMPEKIISMTYSDKLKRLNFYAFDSKYSDILIDSELLQGQTFMEYELKFPLYR